VAAIEVAGQRLSVNDELAALVVLTVVAEADVDRKLLALVRIALADAFHFGRVQSVDLAI
jgi:hypothetical protein